MDATERELLRGTDFDPHGTVHRGVCERCGRRTKVQLRTRFCTACTVADRQALRRRAREADVNPRGLLEPEGVYAARIERLRDLAEREEPLFRPRVHTLRSWLAEGERLFGTPDAKAWRWLCPACGRIAAGRDWLLRNAPPDAVGRACVGRWPEPTRSERGRNAEPCDYGGGHPHRDELVLVLRRRGDVEPFARFFPFDPHVTR